MSGKKDGIIGFILLISVGFFAGYAIDSDPSPQGVGTCWEQTDNCVELYSDPISKQLYAAADGGAANCQCINTATNDLEECHHDRTVCDDQAAQTCEKQLGQVYECAVSLSPFEPKYRQINND